MQDDALEVSTSMQTWVLQKDEFRGNVRLSSQRRHNFYRYSLWRARTGEHLFDGVAGDLAEAMDTMHAHIDLHDCWEGTRLREVVTVL
jgi:hypothetical protein